MQETILQYPNAPYYAQIEDYEHVTEYLDEGRSPLTDPFWRRSGAPDIEIYAHWTKRACGIVCVKTCIETFGGPIRPLHHWINQGIALDGYLIREDPNGIPVEIGWKHATLAELCKQQGFHACPQEVNLEMIENALRSGRILIASVSFEIGTDRPITRQGGHLVTLLGVEFKQGKLTDYILHNPSGRTPDLRRFARIPVKRFNQAFSQRVIIVEKERKPILSD